MCGYRRGILWVWVGKLEGKSPLGRPRRRCEDNIKTYVQEGKLDGMYWNDLVEGRKWRGFFTECSNNIFGSEKCEKFLEYLRVC
jgi:hypothetical protein